MCGNNNYTVFQFIHSCLDGDCPYLLQLRKQGRKEGGKGGEKRGGEGREGEGREEGREGKRREGKDPAQVHVVF